MTYDERLTAVSFRLFGALYMAAFIYELTEDWENPVWTVFFIVLALALVLTRITRVRFLAFLAASSAYVLLVPYPEIANHVNLMVFINLGLMIAAVVSLRRPGSTDAQYFEGVLPMLRLSLVLVYFFAGFHKLNTDFFHPEVSSVRTVLAVMLRLPFYSVWPGVPNGVYIAGGLLAMAACLPRGRLKELVTSPQVLLACAVIAVAAAAAGAVLTVEAFPEGAKGAVVIALACVVILWEVVGGLLLLLPRLQFPVLAFGTLMHGTWALMGFADFNTAAVALLFTFLPRDYLAILADRSRTSVAGLRVERIHLYYLLILLGSLIALLHERFEVDVGNIFFAIGLPVVAAEVVLLWPVLVALTDRNRPRWTGVPILTRPGVWKPALAYASVVSLWAMTPYLGLRTTGNFSMFSNLRTEGERSNHLLLGSNPLKVWGYQEDVVEVLEIDDEAAEIGHHYHVLEGYKLPVVEFRKLIGKWTRAGMTVPVTFVYDGVTYETDDIVNDPLWRYRGRDWEMYLLDFRVIQQEGPNRFRW